MSTWSIPNPRFWLPSFALPARQRAATYLVYWEGQSNRRGLDANGDPAGNREAVSAPCPPHSQRSPGCQLIQTTFAAAFRQTYGQLVAQTPTSDAEWPPVVTIRTATVHRSWPGWIVAGAAFLVTISFWVGWLVAAGRGDTSGPTRSSLEPRSQPRWRYRRQRALRTPTLRTLPSPPHSLRRPTSMSHMSPEWSASTPTTPPSTSRVQVQASDFCNWYGVTGTIREEALEWRSRPALPCDG